MNLTVTPERAEKVDFANPYFKVSSVSSPLRLRSPTSASWLGKTLIVTKARPPKPTSEANHP